MTRPIRPVPTTRRRLLRATLLLCGGATMAALPMGLSQAPGAWPFAAPMALADNSRRDAREERDDRRDDRQDARDEAEDEQDDDDDEQDEAEDEQDNDDADDEPGDAGDGSGSDGRDDSPEDDGASDDPPRNGSGDDSPGRDDSDDPPGDDRVTGRDDDEGRATDDSDDDSDDGRTPRRIRNISVTYHDGWVERIDNGQYELIDNLDRRVIIRPATVEDFDRMMALG